MTVSRACLLLLAVASCGSPDLIRDPPKRLSDVGLFKGDVHALRPADRVLPFAPSTSRFSDYAAKFRFIRFPPGKPVVYDAEDAFDLPVGTVLSQTMSYPVDARDLSKGWRHLETRLLVRGEGRWKPLIYVWNRGQAEGYLRLEGDDQVVSWIDERGRVQVSDYVIPSSDRCATCHARSGSLRPIGIRVGYLNHDFDYNGTKQNQLAHWADRGLLSGVPDRRVPRFAAWDDPVPWPIPVRARAYLEVNCAPCHSPDGSARGAGLDLRASHADAGLLGVYTTSHDGLGRENGLQYHIVPGDPGSSILLHLMAHSLGEIADHALAGRIIHDEGVELVRQWIEEMPDNVEIAD